MSDEIFCIGKHMDCLQITLVIQKFQCMTFYILYIWHAAYEFLFMPSRNHGSVSLDVLEIDNRIFVCQLKKFSSCNHCSEISWLVTKGDRYWCPVSPLRDWVGLEKGRWSRQHIVSRATLSHRRHTAEEEESISWWQSLVWMYILLCLSVCVSQCGSSGAGRKSEALATWWHEVETGSCSASCWDRCRRNGTICWCWNILHRVIKCFVVCAETDADAMVRSADAEIYCILS